jgi:hypothetical protein
MIFPHVAADLSAEYHAKQHIRRINSPLQEVAKPILL